MNTHICALLGTLCCSLAFATAPPKPGCSLEGCAGPLKFYKDIGCEPIYKNFDDCCPWKYNCDHLRTRSQDKCYAFGHEYNPGDKLRKEDQGCNNECTCIQGPEEEATFTCAVDGIPFLPINPGCYRPRNASMCGPGDEICPENPENIAKCEVDGKILLDGEYFEPESDPRKSCYCGPGYAGKHEAPFCKDLTLENCGTELWNGWHLKNRCAPVYHMTQDPALDCPRDWRCEEDGDEIIQRETMLEAGKFITPDPPGLECHIGNLTMRFADHINQVPSDTDICIKCVCDVPPVPTCAVMPKLACTITAADLVDSDEKNS